MQSSSTHTYPKRHPLEFKTRKKTIHIPNIPYKIWWGNKKQELLQQLWWYLTYAGVLWRQDFAFLIKIWDNYNETVEGSWWKSNLPRFRAP